MSADLTTTYLGLELANPLVASASPMTGDPDWLRRAEEAGAAAVVLPSLYEEEIEHEALEMQRLAEFGAGSYAEALNGYFPDLEHYATRTEDYLRKVEAAKAAVDVPVIGSLNGTTRGGWVRWARHLVDAGVDAIELNTYLVVTDPYASCEDVERRYLDLVAAVCEEVAVPVAVKIGPFFSSLPHTARRIVDAGASGLVLFNRFYQADIDLERLEVVTDLQLSHPSELRLPLRWIAILHGRVPADLALTTGVHSAADALKGLLVGAAVVMMTSALLEHGPEHLGDVLAGIREWLDEHEYESVRQLRGSMSLESAPNPEAFMRANYMKTLVTYTPPSVRAP